MGPDKKKVPVSILPAYVRSHYTTKSKYIHTYIYIFIIITIH